MATIAVDFDGVIHAYSRGWADGSIYDPPLPGAIDALHTLMDDYAVFIHTTRPTYPVAQWLEGHGIPAVVEMNTGGKLREFWNDRDQVLVTNRKLPAVAYIDDRGIRFHSWGQALADLPNLI
jgi:hypothetical protein